MGKLIALGREEASGFAASRLRHKTPPDAIPGFEIIGELGRGGMGVVYKARQLSTKRVVALKVILGSWFASDSARARFRREVELTARLQHEGVVRVLEAETGTDQPYYAMDFVDGVPLGTWLVAEQPDVRTILRLFVAVCDAVAHAHEHGVIHRDLKPGNIIVDHDGNPHLVDFGLSKPTGQSGEMDDLAATASAPGQILGTLRYLSPEQAAGDAGHVDTRTDVYSLGVVLYEALTGVLPYNEGSSPSETLRRIADDAPRTPSVVCPGMEPDLETILLKALRKERDKRYQTVAEFADDIRRYLAGDPVAARRPSRVYILRRQVAKHRREIRIGVACLLAFLAVLAGWLVIASVAARRTERAEAARLRREAADIQYLVEFRRHALRERRSGLSAAVPRTPAVPHGPELYARAQRIDGHSVKVPESRLVRAQVNYLLFEQTADDLHLAGACSEVRTTGAQQAGDWACLSLLDAISSNPTDERTKSPAALASRQMPPGAVSWYLRTFTALKPAQALQWAERGLQESGDQETWALLWQRVAQLRHVLNDVDGAREAAEQLVALGEDECKWRLFAADIAAQAGRLEQALAEYEPLRTMTPRISRRRIALMQLMLGEYAQSWDTYTEALANTKISPSWIHYRRATVAWIEKGPAMALADLDAFRQQGNRSFYADVRRYLMLQELIRTGRSGCSVASDPGMAECRAGGPQRCWSARTGRTGSTADPRVASEFRSAGRSNPGD